MSQKSYSEWMSIGGQTQDERGNTYNGKIQGFIRQIAELTDIARYNYHVVIIANCSLAHESLRRLTGGYRADVFDFKKSYEELVFPIVSGTFFRASDLTLQLDLNHKSAGAKTSYSVTTPYYECEITVLFVPTLEIARAMDKYRNSILEYNPRSYLDLDGQKVNASIRETLLRHDSNEFALMNNGLTILSDETSLNERIGQHNKAQLRLLNPQIINGGQTAYTLSRALNEDPESAVVRFAGKEVLVKVITLTPKDPSGEHGAERRRLIDEISAATNRQTTVITTDRFANESIHIQLQKLLFERFGLLYERKRGEFSDGVFAGYIDRGQILERNVFVRIVLTVLGRISRAVRKKVFAIHGLTDQQLTDFATLDRFYAGYELFQRLAPRDTNSPKKYRDALAKVYIGVYLETGTNLDLDECILRIEKEWSELLKEIAPRRKRYTSRVIDSVSGEARDVFNPEKWMNSSDFEVDLTSFVGRRILARKTAVKVEGPNPTIVKTKAELEIDP